MALYGMGTTILEEYQQQIKDLKKDLDQKQLQISQLQNHSESLFKQSEEDQQVMEKQSQEIEKYKRNQAKL